MGAIMPISEVGELRTSEGKSHTRLHRKIDSSRAVTGTRYVLVTRSLCSV